MVLLRHRGADTRRPQRSSSVDLVFPSTLSLPGVKEGEGPPLFFFAGNAGALWLGA